MTARGNRPGDDTDLAYCLDLIRHGDRDRYLVALFAPAAARAALTALFALNCELAKTVHVVSEPMLGQIRLQWWRESVDGIFAGAPRRHAVIQPLAAAVARFGLPRAPFDAMIDARERDLDPAPFAGVEDLAGYCAATEGPLLTLGRAATGQVPAAIGADAGAGVAAGYGIARLLCELAQNRRAGPLAVPADVAARHGLPATALRTGAPGDVRLAAAVAELAPEAARRLAGPAGGRVDRMHATLARARLRRLKKAGYDPYDATVAAAGPGDSWRLLFALLRPGRR
ncbi:MAG: squalene/phytoene synthase family protein [Alphaproteobacteria bacterium]